MSLPAGTRLAHYEIREPLGAGAMGEVYRARDTRLMRDVAIKVLPSPFADDPERLSRFEREARSLAALNHANIAQIYGVDRAGGVPFLALELVPGETLEDRLARGPLPLGEVIDLGCQIAAGLAAAHEAGVVHRDLKPANIRLTPDGTAKLLDFGLAKTGNAPGPDDTAMATRTEVGQLIGTPVYMAPEQVRGRAVDRRADLWAFGCLVYECLAGRRPFAAATLSDLFAAVLEKDVDWSALPANTPPRLRELLERCLCKDLRERWNDAGDARLELLRAMREPAPAAVGARRQRRTLLVAVAATAVLTLAASSLLRRPRVDAPPPLQRFSVHGANLTIDSLQGLALSPDGQHLVYRADTPGGPERLFLRAMHSLEPVALPGTEHGYLAFFSPDGSELGFCAQRELRILTLATGAVRKLATLEKGFSGGAWLDDGRIVWTGSSDHRLAVVPAAGGEVSYHPVAGSEEGDMVVGPHPLPGATAVLCATRSGAGPFCVVVVDLATWAATAIAEGFTPALAGDHVLFQHEDGPLMAIAFDRERLTTSGSAFPVADGIGPRVSTHIRMFAVAGNGTLAYLPRTVFLERGAIVVVDREGKPTTTVEVRRILDNPRFAADGKRIAFRTPAPNCNLWVHDLERDVTTRITREGDSHGNAWLPEDAGIAFLRMVRPPLTGLFTVDAGGAGTPTELLAVRNVARGFVASCSPDGRHVLLGTQTDSGADVHLADLQEKTSRPLFASPFNERAATFSPDGRHIAYVSDEEGREDVFVQPFPALDKRIKISVDGGQDPAWSRDGRELFFLDGRSMMVAGVESMPVFAAGRPRHLFDAGFVQGWNSSLPSYDVSPDGQRFAMVRQRSGQTGAEVHVVLHWFEELRARDPRRGQR